MLFLFVLELLLKKLYFLMIFTRIFNINFKKEGIEMNVIPIGVNSKKTNTAGFSSGLNNLGTSSPNLSVKNFGGSANSQLQKDSISFEGWRFPSGSYGDFDLGEAKRFVNRTGNAWKDELKQETMKRYRKNMDISSATGMLDSEDTGMRATLGVLSFGMTEILHGATKLIDMGLDVAWRHGEWAEEHVQNISRLVDDLRKG